MKDVVHIHTAGKNIVWTDSVCWQLWYEPIERYQNVDREKKHRQYTSSVKYTSYCKTNNTYELYNAFSPPRSISNHSGEVAMDFFTFISVSSGCQNRLKSDEESISYWYFIENYQSNWMSHLGMNTIVYFSRYSFPMRALSSVSLLYVSHP